MVIWKGGDNHCFFSAFDQSGDLGCCGTFGYSRELDGHLADTHWVQHYELAAISLNMIYSLFSLPPASLSCEAFWKKEWSVEKGNWIIAVGRNLSWGWCVFYNLLVNGHFLRYMIANQTKGRFFYLFSYLCFFIKGLCRQCTQCWDVIKA